MRVHGSNLLSAISLAMFSQIKYEKELGYTGDSAFLAGLREVYKALQNEEQLEILY